MESIDVVAATPGLPGLGGIDRAGIVAEALARVAAESSTWLHADLSRHIATLLPAGATASGAEAVALVEELTAEAAGACVELQPEAPAGAARRRDGRPVSDTTDDGICVLEPSSTRSGVYVGMTRGRGQNLGLVVDPTGMADPEEAFAAVIARPANVRTALAVRDRLAGDRSVTLPATGLPPPAMTVSGPGAGSRTAGPTEPCPVAPDATGASAPAAEPIPGAPPAVSVDEEDDDDLAARTARRLAQVATRRPPARTRRR